MKQIAHFDLDPIKYGVASAAEKRSVLVSHKTLDITSLLPDNYSDLIKGGRLEVPNRTSFYSRRKNRDGGILAEINKGRDSPLSWEEFSYEDVQTPDPISHTLYSAKNMVDGIVTRSGADSVCFYVGSGESFRRELSTLLEYKGNRKDSIKPVLMDEVVDYLMRRYKPEVVTGYEADDAVVMESYNKDNHFIIGVDKDFYGAGSWFYNYNRHEEGIVDTRGVGRLWLDSKGGVRGEGLLFKLLQISSEDNSDNYKANCMSDIKWGEKSAYKALEGVESYKEAFERVVSIFKMLYPEKKKVVGWRGETIEIDYMYVLQEMWDMAHMHRWKDDYVDVENVLETLGIDKEKVAPYGEV